MVLMHHPFSVLSSFVTQRRTDSAAIKSVLLPIHLNTLINFYWGHFIKFDACEYHAEVKIAASDVTSFIKLLS